ncbi:MAG: GNAT family N-acetyltransferase [Actinomycetota bacterium]|nr:GNAT family N-acetyltransferase [Actinomycetota bacterium]
MITKLNKKYLYKHKNQFISLLKNIKFISEDFAGRIYEEVKTDIDLYSDYSFLYINNNILKGMILAKPVGNYVFGKKTCEVKYLTVSRDCMGKCVASSLFDNLKNKCEKPFDFIYLTVYKNNKRGIAFYRKMGFIRYIVNNEPQIVIRDGGTPIEHTDICFFLNL